MSIRPTYRCGPWCDGPESVCGCEEGRDEWPGEHGKQIGYRDTAHLATRKKKVYNVTPPYLIGQTRNCLADLVLLSD